MTLGENQTIAIEGNEDKLSAIETALEEVLIPAPAADPWVTFHEGFYYFCESVSHHSIQIRKSPTILNIGIAPTTPVWAPPSSGPYSHGVWAPELHWIGGRWYIYFTADDGKNENHRMWVLQSETSDAQGEYRLMGQLETQGWAIDGTPFVFNGELFLIWWGWPGKTDGRQNIYIAPMSNPWTVSGPRVLIAQPEHDWETVDMPICEGPQILQKDGKNFLVYSASGSWTVDYCQGMLELVGQNVLDPLSWKKLGMIFQKNVGHCSFVKSPCQTEDWILYHAKTKREKGWLDRQVHARRLNWRQDGLPDFGSGSRCKGQLSD